MDRVIDLAWLSGLIDGEGHLAFGKSVFHGRKNPGYSAKLWIGMYSRDAIEKAARIMGTSVHSQPNYDHITWIVDIRGKKARDLLLELLPYLTTKRSEAQLLIAAVEACDGFLPGGGRSLSEEQLALREGYYLVLREAKRAVA